MKLENARLKLNLLIKSENLALMEGFMTLETKKDVIENIEIWTEQLELVEELLTDIVTIDEKIEHYEIQIQYLINKLETTDNDDYLNKAKICKNIYQNKKIIAFLETLYC